MASILVIDDDSANRDILKTRLEAAGYAVAQAEDGEQGVRLSQSLRPDLILMDVMMPKVDGRLACRVLKSNDATKNIPVIMLTAMGQQIDELRGWEAGADEYLTKPCDHKRLLELIAQLLSGKPQEEP